MQKGNGNEAVKGRERREYVSVFGTRVVEWEDIFIHRSFHGALISCYDGIFHLVKLAHI